MKKEASHIYDLFINVHFARHRLTTPEWKVVVGGETVHNLVYIYEGKGFFQRDEQKQAVCAGDLVYFPPGCNRYMVADSKNLLKLYTVNFQAAIPETPAIRGGSWQIRDAVFDFPFVTAVEDEAVRQRFVVLFQRLCHLCLTYEGMQKVRQREVMIELLELTQICLSNDRISYSCRNQVNRIVRYMAEHYHEKLTLASLSKQVGMSPSYFSAAFREVTGRPPIDYLIHLRVLKAKQLLGDGLRVAETAQAVGFSDIYYFSNMFRRLEGISPSQYRADCLKSNGML